MSFYLPMVYCQCLEISILLTKDVPMLQLDFTHMTSPQGWHETCVYLPLKKKILQALHLRSSLQRFHKNSVRHHKNLRTA